MRRTHIASILALLAAVTLIAALVPACQTTSPRAELRPRATRVAAQPLPQTIRAAWVARFHYHYPDDVRTIIQNCAAVGCNTVLWQVRGEGTVAYPSRLEPWSREYGHRDPGFDPLEIAVREAHAHGLRIEAWLNVMPGWKGPETPPADLDPPQLWHARPDWFLRDADGQRQPLGSFYVILNPCLPEVREHITDVVRELLSQYDLDGVHLDYVRYAWDGLAQAKQTYPRDRQTLALYERDTGRRPGDNSQAWNHWRANQLTRLVDDVHRTIDQVRPKATLTAAVWRNPQRAYAEFLQNGVAWLRTGLVDAVMPMAYTENLGELEADVGSWRALVGDRRVVPGLGIYKHEKPWQLRDQLRRCTEWGGDYALFSYESLFPVAGDRQRAPDILRQAQELRHLRRTVLREFQDVHTAALAGPS